ncbi:HD domain-containing protein [Candidatus Gracilibacteria bacterium]|nr:HD domain-containing protein [Candidatus Gracilibacteria bacterium]
MEGFLFEKAVLEFAKYFPKESQKKPFFYHSIRVGVFLWNQGYSEEIQIAGLLHDALEDTDISEKEIENLFGKDVLQIVKSNSKNYLLPKEEILEDIVKRCSDYGIDAVIVKIADVYDNFLFYKKVNNIPEIERCKKLANLILKYKKDYDDKIFNFLEEIFVFEN